jgi:sodium pump decarboxylase gamma subunit
MNNVMNMPALLAANGMTMSERLSEAGVMIVLGVLMVFAVLATIMIVLMIMERVFAKKGKSEAPKKEAAPKVAPAPAPAPVVQQDDGAVIAAITAAISLMLAESGDATYQGGFRVVSFKRSNRNTPWNSGR